MIYAFCRSDLQATDFGTYNFCLHLFTSTLRFSSLLIYLSSCVSCFNLACTCRPRVLHHDKMSVRRSSQQEVERHHTSTSPNPQHPRPEGMRSTLPQPRPTSHKPTSLFLPHRRKNGPVLFTISRRRCYRRDPIWLSVCVEFVIGTSG